MNDEHELEHLLNDLSLGLVMVDPEDLMTLGELLEKIERLQAAYAGREAPAAVSILDGLRRALEAVILEQVPDKNQVMELLGQGVGLLQELQRGLSAGESFPEDLDAFARDLLAAAKVELKATSAAPPMPTPAPKPASTTTLVAEPVTVGGMAERVDQDQDLFFGFIAESLEHIESIEVNIISLEQEPGNKETINAVFRPFHTIKGVSGFLNLKHIHSLTHNVETLLDEARNDRLIVTPALIDLVLDAVDILKKMIVDVRSAMEAGEPHPTTYDVDLLLERVRSLQQGDVVVEPPPGRSLYGGRKLGEILIDQGLLTEEELDALLFDQETGRLRRLGEIVVAKGIIPPEALEDALGLQMASADKRLGEILVETGKAPAEAIAEAVEEQGALRQRKLGEILIREKHAEARDVTGALREQKRSTEEGATTTGHTVKVDTVKLDSLVDMVGELVIAQSLVQSNEKVQSIKDQKLFRDLSHMSRITSELQRTAMALRMVPIRQTFQKMIRLVRDLSRKSSKPVELYMSGEDTEIDRNMVEALYDPLVHMVRNSVDHGLESVADRKSKGKPIEGSIHLRAFHQGGNVVIQIADDGQGFNKARIHAKAVERGVISADDSLSDSAIFGLVFQPGFSTAEKVTDVSGRGVGMDVVKRTIDRLRGKIEVESVLGEGSTVTIRLPLTLAIIDGMIVRVGGHRYILPTVAIRESFRPTADEYHTVKGQGEMIKVRENLLPLIRLGDLLGADRSADDPTQALVIVLENDGERRCVLVDDVLGKQEVVIKSLGERLRHVRSLAGGSILGDGQVGLILDVGGIFEVSEGLMGRARAPLGGAAPRDWDMDDDWGMGPA